MRKSDDSAGRRRANGNSPPPRESTSASSSMAERLDPPRAAEEEEEKEEKKEEGEGEEEEGLDDSGSSRGVRSNFLSSQIERRKRRGDWVASIAPLPVDAANGRGRDDDDGVDDRRKTGDSFVFQDVTPTDDETCNAELSFGDLDYGGREEGSFRAPPASPVVRSTKGSSSRVEDGGAVVGGGDAPKDAISPPFQHPWPARARRNFLYDGVGPGDDDNDPSGRVARGGAGTTAESNDNNELSSSTHSRGPRRVLSSASLVGMLKIKPICEMRELHDDTRRYNLAETVQIDRDGEEDDISECTIEGGLKLDEGDDEDVPHMLAGDCGGGGIAAARSSGTFLPSLPPMVDIRHNPIMEKKSMDSKEDVDSSTFYLQSISSADNITHMSSASDYDYFSMTSDEDDNRRGRDEVKANSLGGRITIKTSNPELREADATPDERKDRQGRDEVKTNAAVEANGPGDKRTVKTSDAKLREEVDAARAKARELKSASAGAADGDASQASGEKLSQASSGSDRLDKVKAAAAKARELKALGAAAPAEMAEEVCEVLGLPKDHPRNVRRGIMSRNTELKLRKMAWRARHKAGGRGEDPDAPRLHRPGEPSADDGAKKRGGVGEPKSDAVDSSSDRKLMEPTAEETADDSASDSSVDMAFGEPSQEKEKDEDKWERIRMRRRMQRRSSGSLAKKSSARGRGESGGDGGVAAGRGRSSDKDAGVAADGRRSEGVGAKNRRGGDDAEAPRRPVRRTHLKTDATEKKDSYRYPPRRIQTGLSVQDDDDDGSGVSVLSGSTSIAAGLRSKIGKIYRRLSVDFGARRRSTESEQTQRDAALVADEDDGSSSEEEDDRGPMCKMNVLSEGEYYLAMSMLVYIYALLRETSMLGHTDISFDEIDVNSFQSDPGFGAAGAGGGAAAGGGSQGNRFLSKTKSAGFIIRVVMDELEKKGAFSSVEKNEGDMNVLREFIQWVNDSHTKQIDAATEQTIKELRRKVARRRWRRAIHAVRLMVRLGGANFNPKRRRAASSSMVGGLRDSITMSIDNLSKALLKAPSISSAISQLSTRQRSTLTRDSDIREIIDGALDVPRYFVEGSLLSNLIESGIEVVYFGDRHPNDVVYSVCCNRQHKRVSVVFRGTVNSHNWLMNMKFAMTEHPNPISENYAGRSDSLGLHTGFSLYLTRQRKDDSLTKIEEIFSNVDGIGKELAPDGDYELSIAGHSLGGALATILAFYAATSSAFARVKAIRVFTYAAPRVGCQKFVHAYQHLERIGKLRHARFTNTRDLVPLVPFHGMSRSYKHVGMHVRLHGVGKYTQFLLRHAMDVSYPKYHGVWSQLCRGFGASLIRNLNSLQGYKRTHTLSEYQRRIRFAIEYRSILAQAGYFHHTIRSRLKTLDEYYFIKGASNVTGTGELTRVALEERAKENVRRQARKIIVAIALVALLEAVVLGSVHYKSIPCENYPVLLYPLYFLTGCRREEEEATCAGASLGAEEEILNPFEQISTSSPSSEITTPGHDEGNELETTGSAWVPSWMDWPWRTPHPAQPPCIWGRCDVPSRPYLPWGIPMRQSLAVATIDSWSFDSPEPNPPELSWEVETLFRGEEIPSTPEEIHFRVSEMVLAGSRGEIEA